ncbi:MAG: hypothetical protein F4Z95_00135 [Gammaproteobacteria bacterium]|nr:hypothetical protein [Gammaproteobacteria bacterium]
MKTRRRAPRFKPIPKLDATPEELARAMFAAVPLPDPSKRRRANHPKRGCDTMAQKPPSPTAKGI